MYFFIAFFSINQVWGTMFYPEGLVDFALENFFIPKLPILLLHVELVIHVTL